VSSSLFQYSIVLMVSNGGDLTRVHLILWHTVVDCCHQTAASSVLNGSLLSPWIVPILILVCLGIACHWWQALLSTVNLYGQQL